MRTLLFRREVGELKNHKLYLSFFLLSILFLLAACSNVKEAGKDKKVEEGNLENLNETGFPVVKDPVKFNVFVAANRIDGDWNDILIWNEYAKMTNIDIDWEQVPDASLEEKRNLTLASDDIPDAFYAAGLTNLDLFKYGKQGTFLPLNDLIEKYAPNLTELMEKYPEVRKAITFPDGNIYAMPTIQDPEFESLLLRARPWFNQKWLDKLGMDMPETTDEFYAYLKAVKENDLNENGKADEIPYGGRNIDELVRWIRGSFGLSKQNQMYIDLTEDGGTIRFTPATEAYKEMLIYIRKLYEEGLINQNIFTIEGDQFLAGGSDELYGSTVFYSPDDTFGVEDVYTGGLALKGPNGEQSFSKSNAVGRVDGLVLTRTNQNPAAMVRWLDYFYSDEGARLQYMGIENETFVKQDDGTYQYVDEIVNSPDGLTMDQEIRKRLTWVGIFPPGIMKQDYFLGSETSASSLEATRRLGPYLSEVSWPRFSYTEEETKVLMSTGADLEKYAQEMRDKFIVGEFKETEWDDYLKTLDQIGLEKYLKVQQEAYERYSES